MERLLAGQPDEPMARALICGLGLMGRTEALPALVPFLAHFRDLVRVDAASALAALGSSQGLDLVLEGSRSPDRLVRLEAVYGLRFFREAEARARLEELCLDPGEIWKREARVSLAAWELAGIGDAAGAREDYLIGLLGRSRPMVEQWAVQALAELGTARAVAELRALAREPTRVGRTALRTLLARGVTS